MNKISNNLLVNQSNFEYFVKGVTGVKTDSGTSRPKIRTAVKVRLHGKVSGLVL
jgi:hypothetical protein